MIDNEEDDEVIFPFPVLDDQGDWDGIKTEERPALKSEYFDEILTFLESGEGLYTIIEALEALSVCPAGFVDLETASLVALESDAATYHILPSGGGIWDETEVLMEIFRAIRGARADFYIWSARQPRGGKK